MKKRIISAVCAAALIVSAAAVPVSESGAVFAPAITASAETYSLPYTATDVNTPTDWGADCRVPSKVYKLFKSDESAQITIEYDLLDGYDYHVAGIKTADMNSIYEYNIKRKYDEAVADGDEELAKNLKNELWKQNSIQGVTLKASLTERDLKLREKNGGEPILDNDGLFNFFASGSLSFIVTSDAIEHFCTVSDEKGINGSLFQVYGIDIHKIKIEKYTKPDTPPEEGFTAFEMWTDLNWTTPMNFYSVKDGGHGNDTKIIEGNHRYTVSFGPAYYSGYTYFSGEEEIIYDAPPTGYEAIKWSGASIWNVDIIGLADAFGASTKSNNSISATEKKKKAETAGIEISNVTTYVDGKEFYKIPDNKLLYGDIEGNGNIRIELINYYSLNGDTYSDSSPFFIKEFYNKTLSLEGSEISVSFDINLHKHSYTSTITKQPTCTENGIRTYTCECGDTYTEVIPATGHSFKDKVVKPTVDSEGYTQHTCKNCGYNYRDNFTPKLDSHDIANSTIKVADQVYSGKSLKPSVTVKMGKKTLKKDRDYSIKLKNNTNCGKATVTVTGKGDYEGTKSANFIIKPAKATISSVKSPKTKQVKVTWKKSAGGVSGYEVMLATNNKFTKGKKTVTITSASTTSKTITKLKKGTTYYAKVRAYKTIGKKKYYGAWSAVKSVKCK